jgi:IS30 family transposase
VRTPLSMRRPPLSASSMEPAHSISAIAQAVGRPKSTVWRELSRNSLPSGRYSPLHAAGTNQLRRRREARIEIVVDRLAEGCTPEHIAGWLKGGNEPGLRAWRHHRGGASASRRHATQHCCRRQHTLKLLAH